MPIRVVARRKLSVGGADLGGRRGPRHAEDKIRVWVGRGGGHQRPGDFLAAPVAFGDCKYLKRSASVDRTSQLSLSTVAR